MKLSREPVHVGSAFLLAGGAIVFPQKNPNTGVADGPSAASSLASPYRRTCAGKATTTQHNPAGGFITPARTTKTRTNIQQRQCKRRRIAGQAPHKGRAG